MTGIISKYQVSNIWSRQGDNDALHCHKDFLEKLVSMCGTTTIDKAILTVGLEELCNKVGLKLQSIEANRYATTPMLMHRTRSKAHIVTGSRLPPGCITLSCICTVATHNMSVQMEALGVMGLVFRSQWGFQMHWYAQHRIM